MKDEENRAAADQPLSKGYEVEVDDNFHFIDEDERWSAGRFTTYEEALAMAKEIVDRFFTDPVPSGTPESMVEAYEMFGDDPFITAFGGAPETKVMFSAWDYAREVANRIAAGRGNENADQGGKK